MRLNIIRKTQIDRLNWIYIKELNKSTTSNFREIGTVQKFSKQHPF